MTDASAPHIPEYTVGFDSWNGDGGWCVYEDGRFCSIHDFKFFAVRRARKLRRIAEQQATAPVCQACRRPL